MTSLRTVPYAGFGNVAASIAGGYGAPECQRRIAKCLGLESAYRSAGRPGVSNRKLRME
ncbi:MAG: hypothetical protein ACYC0Y_10100 [Pirellulales bacterium]